MEICTTSQFLCSLKYPQSRLRTMHNIICDPETFLCDKHIALMEGSLDDVAKLFYAPITAKGLAMVREAVECATKVDFCDIQIIENEILHSGFNTGSSPLLMESIPDGVRLSEAIYTISRSKLLHGLKELKARLKRLDISHNNLRLSNIVVDIDYDWYTICNYNLQPGYGNDKSSLTDIERKINEIAMPDKPSSERLKQQHLYSITTDSEGNTIYPIVESLRRFTSANGVGFKDKYDNVVIAADYIWATDFSCNRAVVQLKNSKMGIIDRKGRYIIEPKYSSIDYNPLDGISIVHDNELETRFNYEGEQLEEWH